MAKKCCKDKFNRVMEAKVTGRVPTLADIKKKIPKGGLMDPGLRKEKTPFNPANLKMGCW